MFRNREIKMFSIIFLLISVIIIIAGFAINISAGILVILSSVFLGLLFFIFTKARYKDISKISDQIDIVLHNDDYLYISEFKEGELSILQSEITKMILRIREQNELLKKEKEHLARSMEDIAHQMRTPLTSVNIILSLLETNLSEIKRKELIHEIKQLFVQMDWLLTSLLKLARFDAGIIKFKKENIKVESLIHAALKPFLISMEIHNIAIKIDVPQNAIINGDFGWLSESIQNILKNCIESVGDDGKIEIVCNDNILFTQIDIHDSGTGFEKEDLPYLFDRFYRGKNSGASGYGVGLALSKMIITMQGGYIIAKNHDKGGAIFSIHFSK